MALKPSKLKTKENCAVVVVESASSVRQLITDILKDLEISKITGVTNLQDALHILEVEPVDWIITSFGGDSEVNALHILKLITLHPQLRNTAVTILWDSASDESAIPDLFELGLLSLHTKSYMRDTLADTFNDLFELMKLHNWDSTLVAAEHVRQFLIKKNFPKARLQFEESLISLYPGSTQTLLNLADAELILGEKEKGIKLLDQVELLDERMAIHCKRLKQKHNCELLNTDSDSQSVAKNVLNIKTAVLIDPDTDVIYHTKELLAQIGVETIETFEKGNEAFQWLSTSSREPDLIIMEWKIPGITGAILVQRIRSLGFHQVPIVVISSLIQNSDIALLREMGVDECQEKPFDKSMFYRTLVQSIQQNRCPTEEKSLHSKIRRLLKADKLHEAERLITQLFQDERTSISTRKEIEAEFCMAKGEFLHARDLGIEALNMGTDSLNMLNLVGKAMLKLKEFEGALKCFERAQKMSSLNIERLLHIAEACLELNRKDQAKSAVDQAKNLDSTNLQVKNMECKADIVSGRADLAKNLMGDLESGKDIISYMNNRAVALAKSGRFDEAINLYQTTIESIPPTWKDQQAAVIYNKGLAYARYGELEKASQTLSAIQPDKFSSHIVKKAHSLLERIKKSIESNTALTILDADTVEATSAPNNVETSASSTTQNSAPSKRFSQQLEIQRGEIACHLVFYFPNKPESKYLEKMPAFKFRDTISTSGT